MTKKFPKASANMKSLGSPENFMSRASDKKRKMFTGALKKKTKSKEHPMKKLMMEM